MARSSNAAAETSEQIDWNFQQINMKFYEPISISGALVLYLHKSITDENTYRE